MKQTIDEMIADAIAEEEIEKSQGLQFAAPPAEPAEDKKPTVTIPLEQYEALYLKAFDYRRLMDLFANEAELSYSGKDVAFSGCDFVDAIKLLVPDVYYSVLANLQAREAENESEGE